ncbi:transposase family protein [Kitasatospora sp. NPDC001539]|uniref:integrase catalytic domain-containing protein n=1 Tax=Kitasatospora sp. NPDC001539 TaxID=3154384 RepID=UPI003318F2F7
MSELANQPSSPNPRQSGPAVVLGREGSVARLMDRDSRGELTTAHVRLFASAMGVTERAVWYWLAAARTEGRLSSRPRERTAITLEVRRLLAFWGGNTAAVHRELSAQAVGDPTVVAPSLRALRRAVRRELSVGERAGLCGGEAARRAHDVFGKRPVLWRNACWEGDHKHVPVQVDVEGELACPWITWFIDCATTYILGLAVTPHASSREAVLAALRTSITRTEPFGPVGGLPAQVRVDRGKEFLCATVTAALGAFAVPVHDLPAYSPHLKGTVEALNDAVEEMFLVSLPRYTHCQRLTGGRSADPDAPPLTFAAFVALLLDWVRWWNTEHHPAAPDGLTSLEAWNADPTPLRDVPPEHLAFFALEDDGRTRTITTNGISWRGRPYIAPWMVGTVHLDWIWRTFLRRSDLEHTFRLLKGALGWTAPHFRATCPPWERPLPERSRPRPGSAEVPQHPREDPHSGPRAETLSARARDGLRVRGTASRRLAATWAKP